MCSLFSLCDSMDCSPPGSSVPGILQARILEWVAMPSSGDLHDPGIKPASLCLLHWQMGSLPLASPGKPLGAHTYQLSPPERLLLVFLDPQSWPGLPGVSLPSSPGQVALVQLKCVLVRILQRNRINRIWINRERGLILRNWLMP